MSFGMDRAEQLYRDLADAEERVVQLSAAVAAGRIAPHRLDLAVWLRDGLREQVADLEGAGDAS